MSLPWLYAVVAGRVARLRALVPKDDPKAIAKHLADLAHLARVGGLEQLEEAVRHAGDLGATGRPIAIVIDAIGRAAPDIDPGVDDRVPAQALLVNLAAIAKCEGASCDIVTVPMVVPGTMARRIAIVMAELMGDALDHGSKKLAIAIKLDGDRVVADVKAADLRSSATLTLPKPP
jgi:hypothetical protein